MRRAGRVPDREGEIVVSRVSPWPDPGELLADRLRDHAALIPEADHRADRLAEIQDSAGASPRRHRAERLRVGEASILRVADLEVVPGRPVRLGEGEVRAVRR